MPPANLINLESVSKSYGIRPLLQDVSLGVHANERIGVLGVNGGGKTTLLEVLAGIEPPDAGRVSHARSLRMAVVTQRDELPTGASVRDVALARWEHRAEYEWAADARVRSVLDGLGVTALGLDTPTARLSGGERRRVALAAALVGELDLVVLDEPTNHLDIEGVRWLADHLVARRCATIVVTHDRWFLDTVCGRTWEVVDGRVEQYEGGYADWVFARAERARQAETSESTRRNLARAELAWLRRGAPARTSKPRFRIEAAEALIAGVPPPRDTVELVSFAKRRLGRTVLELENVTATAGERTLLDDVTWHVGPGDRIGLVGVNGSGKTSLLRLLTGELVPSGGKVVRGQTVHLAHLRQELTDLPEHLRVLEAVEEVARFVTLGKAELSASQLAERLGFSPARQRTPVAELSGGERRRLALTRLLMTEPNVLLLDEPTNDLDIDTLQQLERLLDSWPGTLLVVSHDRYLVERVCDTVVALLGDGRITYLPGGVDEYLARRDAAQALASTTPASTTPASTTQASSASASRTSASRTTASRTPASTTPASTTQASRASASKTSASRTPASKTPASTAPASKAPASSTSASTAPARTDAAGLRAARKDVVRIERQLDRLAARQASLQQALLDAGADVDRLVELDGQLRAVLAEKDELEHEWLLAAETVDKS